MADILTPALGESVTEATIAKWTKNVGDPVKKDELLVELETDKVTVEVPSPAAGILAEIIVAEGETVGPDALLAQIGEAGSVTPNTQQQAETAQKTPEGQKQMSGKSVDVMVPALGESVTEATVATWFKKPGDTVAVDEMLCELETDKVTVEVPSPAAGTLAEILAAEGETVGPDALLAQITEAGDTSQNSAQPRPSVTRPNTAMKITARITGTDSTKRSIRNAKTRRVSTPRNSSGSIDGSNACGGTPPSLRHAPPSLP